MTSGKYMKKMRRTRKSRKIQKKMKTQRLYKQKGCSKRMKRGGGCGCGAPFGGQGQAMKGGNGCEMCGLQQGGSTLSPYPPQPAFVGAPWKADISNWPGVGGQDGVTNHYAMNKYVPFDPLAGVMQERAGSLFLGEYTGGSKKKSNKSKKMSKKSGGGLIPQDLVNFGRTFTYGLGSAYNAINGYQQPVNPLPYKDQLSRL
jgi:hypothetical protein